MKQVGNTITFDHVSHEIPGGVNGIRAKAPKHVLFVVYFDGAGELWYSKNADPSDREIGLCVSELDQYYKSDWKGTNRVLPILIYRQTDYASINCI
jgi:hypothetical protein